MAKKKPALTHEVSALLQQLLDALPDEANNPVAPMKATIRPATKKASKTKAESTSEGRTWPRDKENVRRVRAALGRKLNGYSETGIAPEQLGAPLQFTQPNPVELPTGEQFIYPSLDELTEYYQKRYPNQIDAHYVGRNALLSLLDVERVTAVKIKYGLLPDYESIVKPLGQKLIIAAIYKLQQLLREVEPRQIVLVGVDSDGKEIRSVSRQAQGTQPKLGGLHGTEHSLQAGRIQSFPDVVPPITMGRDGEGIDMVPNSPPN
jgi:hypothetical protein